MAGPTLGTLLIQRLDAALGTTLSQQTQIVNRATSDPVTHPSQTARPEPIPGTLVRDTRESVDRATLGTRSGNRVGQQQGPADTSGARPASLVTTSATTSLGLAARIILNLFSDYQPGSAVVTARSPLLTSSPQGGSPGSSGGPATARATTATAGTTSATAPTTAGATTTANAATVHGTSGADANTALGQALARALAQSLQHSGLFYESHLKGLLTGQHKLADIRQQPQAQLAAGSQASPSAPGGPAAARPAGAQPPTGQAMPGGADPATGSAGTTTQSTTPSGGAATTAATAQQALQGALTPGVDPATHGIVRQQLEALADQSIQWRGEAWPGAPMDWQVRRQPDHEPMAQPDTGTDQPWESEIRLQLPQLGDITLSVRLAGARVQVSLQAGPDTTRLLQQHAGTLYDQMSLRQLELTSITFTDPDPAAQAQTQARVDDGPDTTSHEDALS